MNIPICRDCAHAFVELSNERPPIYLCNRYRSLADGVTRISCDAVRHFRCGIQAIGFEPKNAQEATCS